MRRDKMEIVNLIYWIGLAPWGRGISTPESRAYSSQLLQLLICVVISWIVVNKILRRCDIGTQVNQRHSYTLKSPSL